MTLSNPDHAPEQLVSICRIRDLTEALVIKSMLESSGIECFLGDPNTVRMVWFWSNAVGGVKIWVRQKDAEAVRSLTQSAPEKVDAQRKEIQKPSSKQKYASRFAFAGFAIGLLVLSSTYYFYTRTKKNMPDDLSAIISILCPSTLGEMTLERGNYIPVGTNWFSICLQNAMFYGLVGFVIGNAIQRRQGIIVSRGSSPD